MITLERMYFADEIRPIDELKPGRVKVDTKELEMAEQLIERFAGTWKPEKYEDTYRERLLEVDQGEAARARRSTPSRPSSARSRRT